MDVFVWDVCGNGQLFGVCGDVFGFDVLVCDLDSFIVYLYDYYGIVVEDIVIIVQSVGVVVVVIWVYDYVLLLCVLVFVLLVFKVKLYVLFVCFGLVLMQKLCGNFFVNSYVKLQWFIYDLEWVVSYGIDLLIIWLILVCVLLGFYEVADCVVGDVQVIIVLIQLLVLGVDFVVYCVLQDCFYECLCLLIKECYLLFGFFYDIFGECDCVLVVVVICCFIGECFVVLLVWFSLCNVYCYGFIFDEVEVLVWFLQCNSLKDLYWCFICVGLCVGGCLFEGIVLGLEIGFDLGSMLDYIYCDQVCGCGLLGWFVDCNYFDVIGWCGICVCCIYVCELLQLVVLCLCGEGWLVCVFDVVVGYGCYDLDVLVQGEQCVDVILLCDFSE